MILIESYNCTDKLQAHKKERFWIEHLNSSLNCSIPTRSKKEYYQSNIEQNRQHYIDNRQIISDQNKIKKYDCICGTNCRYCDKAKHFKTIKHKRFIESRKSNSLMHKLSILFSTKRVI